ncbi:MAG: lipopolysaccharide biosynthesis protein [Muribaculaceae bacterium]|nr:lipopolysaccharide biosynthesis protein [Muribaculaceae bacterium]
MEGLKEKTAHSLFWSVLNNGTTQLLNIAFGIILGRLLSPADYGLVGVLTIFTLIAGNLQSSGFSQGLINLKSPTPTDYNSVFWFNVTVSIILYIILFFSAPLIASFFNDERLVDLSRFIFLGFVISSLGIAHAAYMNKNMMNKEVAVCNLMALVISGAVGVYLAFNGFSYWSLAWQQIVFITVLNIGRYLSVNWHPTFSFALEPIKRMFSFSVKILFTNILNTLSTNVLTFIFGRLFPKTDVGNYTRANEWNNRSHSFVSGTMAQVAQTVLVSANDEVEREKRVFRKMTRFTALLSFPLMFGLAIVANEFIVITLTEKWNGAILLLQILCLGGAFLPFYTLFQHLTISSGRSDIYLKTNLIQIVLQVLFILLFHKQGIVVMVIVYSVFNVLWLLMWQRIAYKLINLKLRETLLDIIPFMLGAALTMAAVYFVTLPIKSLVLLFVSRVILGALLYFVVMKLANAKILDECLAFMKQKFKKGDSSKTGSDLES